MPPPGVSPEANADVCRSHRNEGIPKYFWFKEQVQKGAPWDYKRLTPDERYENFGNYNYGYAAAATEIDLDTALRAAGAAETGTHPEWGTPLGGPPFGDDPKDQAWIRRGYEDYFRKHPERCPDNYNSWGAV